jgi:nucleotide-binding universal stress UspA family protein
MMKVESSVGISIRNILFLTDFSEPSETALPFATSIARGYGAGVYALHVFTPDPNVCGAPAQLAIAAIETGEQAAKARIESQLAGLEHETIVDWSIDLWDAVQKTIEEKGIDLIVMGTHGRTGAEKFLMGSIAEEIFRRSPVPVLTIGPHVRSSVHAGGRFHRVLFPTDFTAASLAAAPYAISLAQENKAKLVLLHVMRTPELRISKSRRENGRNENELRENELHEKEQRRFELSVAEAIHQLYETVPNDADLHFPAESLVEYGDPADRILALANDRSSDLIVLGVRDAAGHVGAATHLARATAHKVVAHALCPVLTVCEKITS